MSWSIPSLVVQVSCTDWFDVFSENVVLPYEQFLDWRNMTVGFKLSDVSSLPMVHRNFLSQLRPVFNWTVQRLRKFPTAELKHKQKSLRKKWKAITWQRPAEKVCVLLPSIGSCEAVLTDSMV